MQWQFLSALPSPALDERGFGRWRKGGTVSPGFIVLGYSSTHIRNLSGKVLLELSLGLVQPAHNQVWWPLGSDCCQSLGWFSHWLSGNWYFLVNVPPSSTTHGVWWAGGTKCISVISRVLQLHVDPLPWPWFSLPCLSSRVVHPEEQMKSKSRFDYSSQPPINREKWITFVFVSYPPQWTTQVQLSRCKQMLSEDWCFWLSAAVI